MNTRKLVVMAVIALSLLSFISISMEKQSTTSRSRMTIEQDSVLRHVVLFKFTERTSQEKITEIEQAFGELPGKMQQIVGYEWGLNNSPEGLEKGFTHCFFITFKSEEDRALYLPNPDHQAFVQLLQPHLEDVLVVDYWTR